MLGDLLDLGGRLITGAQNRKYAKATLAESKRQFDVQTNQLIQKRVADAKAAGVHPLFALGASVGASPTTAVGGGNPTGSVAGDALQGLGAIISRQMEAEAKKSEAEAQLAASKAKTLEAASNTRQDGAVLSTNPVTGDPDVLFGPPPPGTKYGPPGEGPHLVVPPEVPAKSSPGTAAGRHPLFILVEDALGRTFRIFNPDMFDDIMTPAFMSYIAQAAGNWVAEDIEKSVNQVKKGWRGWEDFRARHGAKGDARVEKNLRELKTLYRVVAPYYRRFFSGMTGGK